MAPVTSWSAKACTLLVVFAVVLGGVVFNEPRAVEAYTGISPLRCDGTPKYWCHYIIYDVSPPNFTTLGRYYQGSRGCVSGVSGCGAQRWRLDNAVDFRWNGSGWEFSYQSPTPSPWYTNPTFDGYKMMGGQWTMNGGGYVQMHTQYYECTMAQGCYLWNGDWTFHYLT